MLITALSITLLAARLESAVLDPSVYLAPGPPLTLTRESIPPGELWLQPLEDRNDRAARRSLETTTSEKPPAVETGRMFWPRYSSPETSLGISIPLKFSLSGSYGKQAIAPSGVIGSSYTSLTGLSRPRAPPSSSIGVGYGLGSIGPSQSVLSISSPLNLRSNVESHSSNTASLGSIGFTLSSSQPSLGKTVASALYGYGNSALAGSGYGSYGLAPSVRVYGGDRPASWSGWGNGRWGHYGKG